jgi:murein DD-endopeptidase MepM/ murein hydrolase activator NlpD
MWQRIRNILGNLSGKIKSAIKTKFWWPLTRVILPYLFIEEEDVRRAPSDPGRFFFTGTGRPRPSYLPTPWPTVKSPPRRAAGPARHADAPQTVPVDIGRFRSAAAEAFETLAAAPRTYASAQTARPQPPTAVANPARPLSASPAFRPAPMAASHRPERFAGLRTKLAKGLAYGMKALTRPLTYSWQRAVIAVGIAALMVVSFFKGADANATVTPPDLFNSSATRVTSTVHNPFDGIGANVPRPPIATPHNPSRNTIVFKDGGPFSFPIAATRLGSGVGWRKDPFTGLPEYHVGLDIPAPYGTPVHAAGNGVVEEVVRSNVGYGNHIRIRHRDGLETLYGHLSSIPSSVYRGAQVSRDQEIGLSGSSGYSTAHHLHFGVFLNGRPINPASVVPNLTASFQPKAHAPSRNSYQLPTRIAAGERHVTFDAIVDKLIKQEAGLWSHDINGPTKYGIHVPKDGTAFGLKDTDIPALTVARAKRIYHTYFWNRMGNYKVGKKTIRVGGDNMPENIREVGLFTMANFGAGAGNRMIRESNYDPIKLAQLNVEVHKTLLSRHPKRYGPNVRRSWLARDTRLASQALAWNGYAVGNDLRPSTGGDTLDTDLLPSTGDQIKTMSRDMFLREPSDVLQYPAQPEQHNSAQRRHYAAIVRKAFAA